MVPTRPWQTGQPRGWRTRPRWDTAGLAAELAMAANRHDRDDIHWPTVVHPGGIVWATALAVGAELRSDWPDLLSAAALGYQADISLARALGPTHRRLWHATATCGTVASALTAAYLIDPDPDFLSDAAGHAISIAGGSSTFLLEHSSTGVFHRGHAALAGIAAARAALLIPGATRSALEAGNGVLTAMTDSVDLSALRAPWVGGPALAEVSFRCHPTCGYAQTAVEACLRLGVIELEKIAKIEIEVPERLAQATLEGVPQSRIEAWWSIKYAVTNGLLGGSPAPTTNADYVSGIRMRLLRATTIKKRLGSAPEDLAARVQVRLTSGQALSAVADHHLGQPQHPAPREVLAQKWRQMDAGVQDSLLRRLDSQIVRDVTAHSMLLALRNLHLLRHETGT